MRKQTTPTPAPSSSVSAAEQVAILREARARTHSPSDRLAYSLDLRLVARPELIPASDWTPGEVA